MGANLLVADVFGLAVENINVEVLINADLHKKRCEMSQHYSCML